MPDAGAVQLNIGPAIMPDFMTGISSYCILAWPTHGEMGEFHRVSHEMVAQTLRLTLRANRRAIDDLQRQWPQFAWSEYLELATTRRRTAFGRLQKRLDKRMSAALIGIGHWHNEIPNVEVGLPGDLRNTSIDQLSAFAQRGTNIDDAENVEKLVWRASLPIIHLAMAVQIERSIRNHGVAPIGIDTQDLLFFRAAVEKARTYEAMVLRDPIFASGKIELTRVRWIE
jgi:hypothetical protein